MAVLKQGGGPNPPVQLDPVQQIVGVHWPARLLAVRLSIERRDPGDSTRAWSLDTDVVCSPTVSVDQDKQWHYYLGEFQYQWGTGPDGQPPTSAWVYNGSDWTSGVEIDEIAGVPDLPIVHSGDKELVAEPVQGPLHTTMWPRAEWQENTGGEYGEGIPLPLQPELTFEDIDTATLQMRGNNTILGTACHTNDGVVPGIEHPDGATRVYRDINDDTHEDLYAPLEVDLSAITLTALGRNWRKVAAKISHNTNLEPTTAGSVWVLFERIKGSS